MISKQDARIITRLDSLINEAQPSEDRNRTPLLLARLWLAYATKYHKGDRTVIADAQALVNLLRRRKRLKLVKPLASSEANP